MGFILDVLIIFVFVGVICFILGFVGCKLWNYFYGLCNHCKHLNLKCSSDHHLYQCKYGHHDSCPTKCKYYEADPRYMRNKDSDN